MITLALAGKPNCGKSTFFKAATLANVEIANYPFTTINPNFGVAYVRTTCPCKGLQLTCGHCTDGNRFVPVNLIDVAGLVPDAHKGKGLGNQFLDNLRQADAILHIIDAGVAAAQVDLFVPHQANLRIIEKVAAQLGFSDEQVFFNLDRFGNTSCASIPCACTTPWRKAA